MRMMLWGAVLAAGIALATVGMASAQSTPPNWTPAEGDYATRDFPIAGGGSLAELKMHYRTLGAPVHDVSGRVTNAVLLLHGTGGTGAQFLSPQFADELFGPGQPLDVTRYYVIMPDNLGHGASSKPSDGLRARFPEYGYADMVEAQRRMLVEGLKVDRLRLILGTSMGCMHAFVWGETHPDFAQALMPLACQPTAIVGRNRLWRTMLKDAIRADPVWNGGDYAAQPVQGLRTAQSLLILAGASPLPMQNQLPTREAVDVWIGPELARRMAPVDANDMIYQLDASRTYDPSKDLEKIVAPMTWVNSADDFINPPELGIAEREAKRLKTTRFVLIPASEKTRGHGSHTWAVLWKDELAALLKRSE